MSSHQEATRVFYMCGLEEAAAEQAARCIRLPPSYMNEETAFDNPSWGLYRYWVANRKGLYRVETSADLHEALRDLGFRPEIVPLANFNEAALSHLEVRNWATRLAYIVYHQTMQIPMMPLARF